jgi:hypothetical protein
MTSDVSGDGVIHPARFVVAIRGSAKTLLTLKYGKYASKRMKIIN